MTPERVMEWAVRFIGCMDPELRNDGVIESAFSHAEWLRSELTALRQQAFEDRMALERLAMKSAADGCPREAVSGCTLTREYGKSECVACWKRWAGIDTANAALGGWRSRTLERRGWKGGIVRTLIGHEYEVRVEHFEDGTIDGWFRAKYLTPHARQMGWLWDIDDPDFTRLGFEEVSIVEVRPLSNTKAEAEE